MFLGISCSFQPGDAVAVKIVDIIQDPVLSVPMLRIFDHSLNTAFVM
jgi:hypothetical protein